MRKNAPVWVVATAKRPSGPTFASATTPASAAGPRCTSAIDTGFPSAPTTVPVISVTGALRCAESDETQVIRTVKSVVRQACGRMADLPGSGDGELSDGSSPSPYPARCADP